MVLDFSSILHEEWEHVLATPCTALKESLTDFIRLSVF
jgi:hypothetical protein